MVLIKSKYKVVSKLNKNIWNDNAKLLSFNKNKWSKLKSNIKRDSFLNSQIPWYKLNQQKNNAKQNYSLGISNNYPLYENESDYYLKKSNLRFFKTNFFNDIQFRLSHGLLTKGQLNKIILKAKNKKKTILFNDLKEKMLLQKLDYSLWSLNLVKSIFEVKQLISHKHVYVNGKVLNMNMYNIKNNDTISLDYSFSSLINMNSYSIQTR